MADDVTNPNFLLDESSTELRGAKILSGRGTFAPGYNLIKDKQEGIASVKVVKRVSPLDGQGPASPEATGRYANMDGSVVPVTRRRVQRSVAPNTGFSVVPPPKNYLRRMDNPGAGNVSEF